MREARLRGHLFGLRFCRLVGHTLAVACDQALETDVLQYTSANRKVTGKWKPRDEGISQRHLHKHSRCLQEKVLQLFGLHSDAVQPLRLFVLCADEREHKEQKCANIVVYEY